MTGMTRRGLLSGAAAVGVGLSVPSDASAQRAVFSLPAHERPTRIGPGDPRYHDLVLRGQNRRYVAEPEYIKVPRSTDDVAAAVQDAVRDGKRIAVRGGGHGFEDFVDSPDVEVVLDMSRIADVDYDSHHRAFSIGAGATLEHVYRSLYYGWGVTVPGGGCLGVGVGGHFSGGGYGPLSRLHGSVVDHLYGVEVVVVDGSGRVRVVTATREGPNRDLWWAHTGGGGGNFGVVTRYLMRSRGVTGTDPAEALPKPPSGLLSSITLWDWNTVTREGFTRTLRNFFTFYERHSAADSAYASLYSPLLIPERGPEGGFLLSTQIDAGIPDAKARLDAFNKAIVDGVDPKPYVGPAADGPFLIQTVNRSIQETADPARAKAKAAYLRKGYTDDQIDTLWRYLTSQDASPTVVLFVPYGGKVNTVAPHRTATAQRDSIMKMVTTTAWSEEPDDARNLEWSRNLYRDLYRDTGGVPLPNATNDGSYINYPDNDLADPRWNTSGVPWHALYYKGNYPRLQRVKATWDPRNVFRHALSIRV
jgi:hypothetical protein